MINSVLICILHWMLKLHVDPHQSDFHQDKTLNFYLQTHMSFSTDSLMVYRLQKLFLFAS